MSFVHIILSRLTFLRSKTYVTIMSKPISTYSSNQEALLCMLCICVPVHSENLAIKEHNASDEEAKSWGSHVNQLIIVISIHNLAYIHPGFPIFKDGIYWFQHWESCFLPPTTITDTTAASHLLQLHWMRPIDLTGILCHHVVKQIQNIGGCLLKIV